MESEYSMCLGLLMSYKEPGDVCVEILGKASEISTCLQEGRKLVVEKEESSPSENSDVEDMLKSSDEGDDQTEESPATTPEPAACLQ